MRKQEPYTLTASDVGKPWLKLWGRVWLCCDFIGRILPGDVGKRVYLIGDVLQVENDEQRDARLKRREVTAEETERRERQQAPRTGYPGAEQMMRWQRDYK